MYKSFFLISFTLTFLVSCHQSTSHFAHGESSLELPGPGALLTTNFRSFEQFRQVVGIEYEAGIRPQVCLTHVCEGQTVKSVLKAGISEADIMEIKSGGFWGKLSLCFRAPYFIINRQDVLRVFILSRRRNSEFGWGDVAFYDLAETMMNRIEDVGLATADSIHFTEKGYINTFNHVTSQAIMTTIFSESFADFIADMHERSTLPALITGAFTEEQIQDVKNGAVDNYVDFINNEWGQELGKALKAKYNITRYTRWTPQLLAHYLNDAQLYFSRVFDISFKPFQAQDELVQRFSNKINIVMHDLSSVENF